MHPLDGITVLALEHAVAAPLCTRHLADLGARVIKIERPGGGDFARAYDQRVRGLSSHFIWANRGKESLTLDIKPPEGRVILHRLVARADVLVQNLAPGAAARLGLSFEALAPSHPGLIVCDISGYGDDPDAPGPCRDRKAYDLLIQSESGFLSVTGSPQEMAKAGCAVADIAAGMYAYSNVLAALLQRGRTGRGSRIDVSMLESMVEWMGFPMYYAYDGAAPPPRAGAAHATIYPYGPFPTGDGRQVLLAVQNEREWQSFCAQVLRQPDLAADPRFASNAQRTVAREALRGIIESVFAMLGLEEVVRRLDAAQIASAQVNQMADVWQHPQLLARGRWREASTVAGPVPALVPPGLPADAAAPMGAVPGLGQHTDGILRELGYDTCAIEALRASAVV